MKKLKLDELQVESFATTAQDAGRGTILGHQTMDGLELTCAGECVTNAPRVTCSPAECTGTTPGASAYCVSGTNCSGAPGCHPYGISNDWTFCHTECCNDSNVYTCYNYSCGC